MGMWPPLSSPKAPAVESKRLVMQFRISYSFLLVASLTYKECCTIVADIFSCFCNCGWPIAATASGVYPWEKQYNKARVLAIDG
jgi:hypothetical protein